MTSDLNLQNKADAVGLPYIETPPTTASLRAKLTASLRSPGEGPSLVTLSNEGPATARSIEYAISTLPDAGPPHFRAGPWTVDRLDRSGTDEQRGYGFYAAVVLVTVTWTDDDGAHELSWTIEFPEKPTGPRAGRQRSR